MCIGKSNLIGQKGFILVRVFKQVHGKDHRILVSLRFDSSDSSVIAELVHVGKFEGVLSIIVMGKETSILAAEKFDKKGFTVSGFTY